MIEESSTKRFAQKRIVKVGKAFPRSNATDSDFGNEDMDVRIPLKATAEGVEDTDKTGSKTFGFVELAEHTKNDITNRIKETVKKRTISSKENTEFFGNGKHTMSVDTLNEFKGHGSCAMNGIKSATRRTETAFTAEWDKLKRTTRRTPAHSTAERRIAAKNHFFNIFESGGAELECVLDFFVMI